MKTLAEHLKAVKALIDTPEKWTKDENARDANGNCVPCRSRTAVCFCALGALIATATTRDGFYDGLCAIDAEAGGSAIWFNDHSTHAEVMAMFDRAIKKASA